MGKSSYAFCLWDDQGDLLYDKWAAIDDTKNIEAEAEAISKAPIHCKQTQFNKVIIQRDSLTMQKILNRDWDCPWSISDIIEQVWTLIKDTTIQYQYIFKEWNKLADHLANYAIEKRNFTFTSFQ